MNFMKRDILSLDSENRGYLKKTIQTFKQFCNTQKPVNIFVVFFDISRFQKGPKFFSVQGNVCVNKIKMPFRFF